MADMIPGYGRLIVSERNIDANVSAARLQQVLRGYPPGRVEDWVYHHIFTFVRRDPESSVGTQSFTINVGGCSAFEWLGIGFHGDIDNSQDPATGIFWTHDPGETLDLSFYSLNGTRAHQSEPVQASFFKGTSLGNALTDQTFDLPFYFDEPQMLPPNDTIRVEAANRRQADDNDSNNTIRYIVTLFGIRWYAKRT